jgi:RHS repeat-associated protein
MMTFSYNTDGQRVAKQPPSGTPTGFLYDHKKLLQETEEVGGEISKTYSSDGSDEFGDLIGIDADYTYQYDAQANTLCVLEDGATNCQYKYYAYGEIYLASIDGGRYEPVNWTSLPLDLVYNQLSGGKKGYYLDMETALYLLGSGSDGRYYDPLTARFVNEDPEREAKGNPNLFMYAENDPVNRLDPSGHGGDDVADCSQAGIE